MNITYDMLHEVEDSTMLLLDRDDIGAVWPTHLVLDGCTLDLVATNVEGHLDSRTGTGELTDEMRVYADRTLRVGVFA